MDAKWENPGLSNMKMENDSLRTENSELRENLKEINQKIERLNKKVDDFDAKINQYDVNYDSNKIAEVPKKNLEEKITPISSIINSEQQSIETREVYTIIDIPGNLAANIGENGSLARTTMMSVEELTSISKTNDSKTITM